MKLTTLLLASAVLLPATHAAANENSGIALFAQTVNDNSVISEGYANPEDALRANTQAAPTNRSTLSGSQAEIWVSDVDTVLFNDADRDGYFAGFRITLDVDVSRQSADVFADIYLSSNGTSPQLFHTTNVFSVHEQDSFDRYSVVVDLTDNISAGNYDVAIDVINAQSSEIEDTISFRTHSNLSGLPLESQNNQFNQNVHDPYNDPYYNDPYYDNNLVTTFTVSSSSGVTFSANNGTNSSSSFGLSASVTEFRGGAGWATLLVLAAAAAFRAKRA